MTSAKTGYNQSLIECRKLELIAAIAGSHKLAVEELKMLLKLKPPEALGSRGRR